MDQAKEETQVGLNGFGILYFGTGLVRHYCHVSFPFVFSQHFLQLFCIDLESCGRTLAELIAAVQELGRRHPLLSKQLSESIAKLGEIHHHTLRLAEYRSVWLKKVVINILNCTCLA